MIPDELGSLIGCLHDHTITYSNTLRFEHTANLNPLILAILKFEGFRSTNPDYLLKRFEIISNPNSERGFRNRLEKGFNKMLESSTGFQDQQIIAENFGLLKPEEEEAISLQENVIIIFLQIQTNILALLYISLIYFV